MKQQRRRINSATSVVDFSTLHVLRDDKEYQAAVGRIDELLDSKLASDVTAKEELDFRSVLVKEFEDRHYPIGPSSPQEVVAFMLEQKGMTRSDLHTVMGGKSRVSDFFNGVRGLSTTQILALRKVLGIPADLLLAAPTD